MAFPRFAPWLALTLLLPLTGAAGVATVADAQADERIILGITGLAIPSGSCSAASADLLSIGVERQGDDLVFRLALRDASAPLACRGASLGHAIGAASFVHLEPIDLRSDLRQASVQVYTNPTDDVRLCWSVRVAAGTLLTCETRSKATFLAGSAWTATFPAHGTGSVPGGTATYDLRGQALRVFGQAVASFDLGTSADLTTSSAIYAHATDFTERAPITP